MTGRRTHTVKELKGKGQETCRCSAMRIARYHGEKAGGDLQCKNLARLVIDGKPLCQKHARSVALQIVMQKWGK